MSEFATCGPGSFTFVGVRASLGGDLCRVAHHADRRLRLLRELFATWVGPRDHDEACLFCCFGDHLQLFEHAVGISADPG